MRSLNIPPRRRPVALLAACSLVGALLALAAGQDAGFDLRNYHWYDAWAALHGRLDVDVAPAQLQTFFNPALDVLYYGLVQGLGAAGGAAVLGALHGLLPGLAACLTLRLLPDHPQGMGLAALTAASALMAPVFLAEVGTSQGDLIVGALALAGLLGLLQPSPRAPLLWGAATGLALGLKPTVVPFVLGGLPVLWLRGGWPALRLAALGGALGWGLGGGWWAVALLRRFDNPFFPMLNGLFRSDWAAPENFFDRGYFPSGLDWALLPVRMAFGGEVSWFYEWRDARWAALVAVGAVYLARTRAGSTDPGGRDLRHLLLWAGVAWLAWLRSSAMIRYLAPLEAAAPALLIVGLARLSPRRGVLWSLGLIAALALWMRPADYERVPFQSPALGVALPPLPTGPAPVVVTAGEPANSYVATAFPPAWRHVRVVSSVVWHEDDTLLQQRAAQILAEGDPVLFLTGQDGEGMPEALGTFGLRLSGVCQPVASAFEDGIELCEVERLP